MKIRDGSQRMENQIHLLEDARKLLPHIGRDLWKAVDKGISEIRKKKLRKGRTYKQLVEETVFLLEESVFLFLLKGLNMYVISVCLLFVFM